MSIPGGKTKEGDGVPLLRRLERGGEGKWSSAGESGSLYIIN